ncbi:Protein FAR-RED IMPAIRED RESPONSE 1 [Bienertia sinuspersici]
MVLYVHRLSGSIATRRQQCGCAFITNEKEESFKWLLQTFKRAMCQQEPKSIFTDLDKAMSKAIEKK